MRWLFACGLLVACGKSSAPPSVGSASGSSVAIDAIVVVDATVDAAAAPSGPVEPAPKGIIMGVSGTTAMLANGPIPPIGSAVEIWGEKGKLCDAVLGKRIDGPRPCKFPRFEVPVCADAVYAVAPGDRLVQTTTVKAASPEQTAAGDKWFEEGPVMRASEKQQLEKLSPGFIPTAFSTRILALPGMAGMTLVYAKRSPMYGPDQTEREIHFIRWGGDAPEGTADLWTSGYAVNAPAPSRVVGAELDGDGAIDAIVTHATGSAVIFTKGDTVTCDSP